jgi:hypothetical protein
MLTGLERESDPDAAVLQGLRVERGRRSRILGFASTWSVHLLVVAL